MRMKLCGAPGCNKLVTGSYFCHEHQAQADARRKQSAFANAKRYANYNDPAWRKASKEYMQKVGHCETCGTTNNLQVHHIIPVRFAPDLFLDPSNFQCLCRACHQVETQREIQSRKRK